MTDSKKSPSDYEKLLYLKEVYLIEQHENVSCFVIQTDHGAREIRNYLMEVHNAQKEINDTLKQLLALTDTSEEFQEKGVALCQRTRDLKQYTRDMNNALFADLARHQPNILQNAAFLASMILGPWTAVQKGFGNGAITADFAAGAGGVLGLGVIFKEKIKAGFRAASKAICSAPKQIKAGFRAISKAVCEAPQQILDSNSLVYVRETIKEKSRAAQKRLNMWKLKT